jgi:transcriptional regulator with XRE-family HTH domain
MKKSDAIKYFGSQAEIAKVLKISRQAVGRWPEKIPELSAMKLARITFGGLVYEEREYQRDTTTGS